MCQAMQAESVSGPAAAQAAGLQRKELLPLSVETRKGFDRAREGFDGEGWGRVGERTSCPREQLGGSTDSEK